jgi:hypothetical protein
LGIFVRGYTAKKVTIIGVAGTRTSRDLCLNNELQRVNFKLNFPRNLNPGAAAAVDGRE